MTREPGGPAAVTGAGALSASSPSPDWSGDGCEEIQAAAETIVRDALRRSRARGGTLAVLLVDVGDVAEIDRAFGHEPGARMLRELDRRLRAVAPPGAPLVRLARERFVVVCEEDHPPLNASRVAQALVEAARAPLGVGDQHVRLTATVGLALAEQGIGVAEELLRDADAAAYAARAAREPGWLATDPVIRERSLRRLRLEDELSSALERGELALYFQPIVAVRGGTLLGVEALVRWRHPTRGLVEPREFLPLAERSGAIVEIGDWVIGEVCQQVGRWMQRHPERSLPPVSVNVSGRELRERAFVTRLTTALVSTQVAPRAISLEIAESSATETLVRAIETLTALKRLGVGIVLDGFGGGRSSLSHLARLPIDGLKLDRAFIGELAAAGGPETVVEALVGLGHALGLTITALGVETAEQLALVRGLRIDAAQGHLIARPAPAASLLDLDALELDLALLELDVAGGAGGGDDLLSLSTVAATLGVSPSTVRRLADQGDLPGMRTEGGHRRFRRRDVQRLARKRGAAPSLRPLELPPQPLPGASALLQREGNALLERAARAIYDPHRPGWFASPQGIARGRGGSKRSPRHSPQARTAMRSTRPSAAPSAVGSRAPRSRNARASSPSSRRSRRTSSCVNARRPRRRAGCSGCWERRARRSSNALPRSWARGRAPSGERRRVRLGRRAMACRGDTMHHHAMERVSAASAALLELDSSGAEPHVGWLARLERDPLDVDALRARIDERLARAPRLRQLVAGSGGELDWHEDASFSLARHVVAWPHETVGEDRLRELVDRFLAQRLPRERPLWRVLVVPRTRAGGAAIVAKLHRALADDGHDATQLRDLIFDPAMSDDALALDEYRTTRRMQTLAPASQHPARLGATLRRVAIAHTEGELVSAPPAFLDAPAVSGQTFVTARVELGRLARISERTGTAAHGILLALVAGALRRLAIAGGTTPVDVRALVPLSIRADGLLGQAPCAVVELPVAERRPAARLAAVREALEAVPRHRRDTTRDAPTLIAGPPEELVRRLTLGSRLSNLTIPSARGPARALHVGGMRVRALYPVAPILDDHALTLSTLSYNHHLHIGAVADPRALRAVRRLPLMLADAVEELGLSTGAHGADMQALRRRVQEGLRRPRR